MKRTFEDVKRTETNEKQTAGLCVSVSPIDCSCLPPCHHASNQPFGKLFNGYDKLPSTV